MKKCLILFLVCSLLVACCQQVRAQVEYEFETRGGIQYLVYHDAKGPVLTVPQQVNGVTVTAVCVEKLRYVHHREIKALELPETVTTISFGILGALSGLEAIAVAEENPSFSVLDGVLYNKDYTAIVYCPKGKKGKLEMPHTVTQIADRALQGAGFSEIVFSNAITTISPNGCEGCGSLVSVTLPENLAVVNNGAFMGCTKLKMVEFPASLNLIGQNAFGYTIDWVSDDCLAAVPIKDFVVYGKTPNAKAYANTAKFQYYDLNLLEDTENPLEAGDLSADRNVDAKDALLALKYAVGKIGLHTRQIDLADVNEDGAVNAKDALQILCKAVGK